MGWAKNSLGTVEHMEDMRRQNEYVTSPQSDQLQVSNIRNAVRNYRTSAMRTYTDRFDSTMSINMGGACRLFPRVIHCEDDECLLVDEALGHVMHTIGFGNDHYYSCGICSAYLGRRVQKLTKPCDKKARSVASVEKLGQAIQLILACATTVILGR